MPFPDISQNYFELFGLNPAFDLDIHHLQAEQQRLQAVCHPDRHVNGGEREKRLSVQMSSWVNQAYETLRDPVKRSRYLLENSGAEIPDDSETTADAEFLMEQIELREAIENCRHSEDALDRCAQIESSLAQRAKQLASEFVEHFEQRDLEAARQSSLKMQFIQRVQQQLAELQFELEDI